jgi:formate hydrogenlyase subunit 4
LPFAPAGSFSLLFLVVQWAFSSLSPRLNLFRDDPIVWRTFAFAIGVFVFPRA